MKTLQVFSLIVGILATGSLSALADEDKGDKKRPPRAERGERPEGERRGPGQRRGGPRQVPKEILEKFDKDGDGKLNEEERKAAMKDRGGRGGRPQGGRPPGGKKPGGKKPGGKKPE